MARIYVASLSDYNAGRLVGDWIDADQEADEIQAEVTAMLATSREQVAEEWAIHDFEGFGSYRISEWESFTRVSLLGRALAHAEAEDSADGFGAWLGIEHGVDLSDYDDDPEGLFERFREQYRGRWDSFKDYVLDEYGAMVLGLDELEAFFRRNDAYLPGDQAKGYASMVEKLVGYIDWDLVTRDLRVDFTIVDAETGGGVHLFENEV